MYFANAETLQFATPIFNIPTNLGNCLSYFAPWSKASFEILFLRSALNIAGAGSFLVGLPFAEFTSRWLSVAGFPHKNQFKYWCQIWIRYNPVSQLILAVLQQREFWLQSNYAPSGHIISPNKKQVKMFSNFNFSMFVCT